ncbi:hypothetical protein ACU8KH_02555 [Lachancea thermotolerans]
MFFKIPASRLLVQTVMPVHLDDFAFQALAIVIDLPLGFYLGSCYDPQLYPNSATGNVVINTYLRNLHHNDQRLKFSECMSATFLYLEKFSCYSLIFLVLELYYWQAVLDIMHYNNL